MLGSAEVDSDVLIADLEAGMGTLTRLGDHKLDAIVVVVEPTAKALEAGRRIAGYAAEARLGRVVLVANRVRDDSDRERVADAFANTEFLTVPDDPAVRAADRQGQSPVDAAADSPAVKALTELADRLAST